MTWKIGLWIVALGLLTLSTAVTAQTSEDTSGGQVLGMAQNPPMEPTPQLMDYLNAAQLAHSTGVKGNESTEKWSALESSGGDIQIDDFAEGINGYQSYFHDTAFLGIQVLNTTAKETPSDLMNVPFDDPQMLTRFNAFIDALLAKLAAPPRYLSIGNEVDVYLSAHPQEWAAYKTFYDGAVAHVHQVAPQVQVGVTATYGGLLQHSDEVTALNQHSDVFILTYYPLKADFSVQSPDAPLTDFPKMVELANGLPVVLQEVGYPSAELLGSSEDAQAQFVTSIFTAWESAGDAIPFLDFFLLTDMSENFCSTLESYYGLTHPNFHAYLCSLGLRSADGTPKQAWQTFVDEAEQWRHG
ncbi:MAG: hypothetical protein GC204_19480 [Chloroflexi bacterium]|nr:hypothetical protein [Chloroflexota bacterium]